MKKALALVFAASILSPYTFAQTKPAVPPEKPETSHLAFVTEYIRELSAIEDIRAKGQEELKRDPDNVLTNAIHAGTLVQLELRSQSSMLKTMNIKSPAEDLIPDITGLYDDKIAVWKEISDISAALLEGLGAPLPGIDYGKMAAEMPQLRAQLDYLDQTLFQATPLVFATLIDQRADSQGHVSHLIITKAERQKLIDDLDTDFGPKLDQEVQNYTVSTANVLKNYLQKGFKCSDEPWE